MYLSSYLSVVVVFSGSDGNVTGEEATEIHFVCWFVSGPESFAAVPYSVSEFLLSEGEPEPRGFF